MIYRDKVFHALGGAVISGGLSFFIPSIYCILISFIIAGLKEVYDSNHPEAHTFDGWDAYWTVFGGLAIQVLCFIYGGSNGQC